MRRLVKSLKQSATTLFSKSRDFDTCILNHFERDDVTLLAVKHILSELQIPIPKKRIQFMDASEGVLIFLDDFGVVVRIEHRTCKGKVAGVPYEIVPIDNNPLVLRPLRSFDASLARVEIVPGCPLLKKEGHLRFLATTLQEMGIHFMDISLSNGGLLPLKSVSFPEGIPVVIDRFAARKLTEETQKVGRFISQLSGDLRGENDPQDYLYTDLRDQLNRAWPEGSRKADKQQIGLFWKMCKGSLHKGILVSGWMDGSDGKSELAKAVGAEYRKSVQKIS